MNTRLSIALDLIRQTREYTIHMLDTIAPSDWFHRLDGVPTHVGWQVGHLAVAEYFLCLVRVRGVLASDRALIEESFVQAYSRDSTPDPDPAANPAPGEIRAVFDRVHEQALRELSELPEPALDEAIHRPHPLFTTKLGSLLWCPRHEMSHAGQIGLLRRLMGQSPMW